MEPTEAVARIAAAINASDLIGTGAGELRYAAYPHEGVPGKYPCLQLFWDETTIEGGDARTWLMSVRGQLLTALLADPPREVPKVDSVIVGLVDLFDSHVSPANYHLEQAGSADRAQDCSIVRVSPSVGIAYGSEAPNHYGAELFWFVKLRRMAGA